MWDIGGWFWAIPADKNQKPLRCEEIRCLIRHQTMERLEGSTLRYRDQGFVPVSDLGGSKRAGWQDPNHLPARPVAAFHGRENKAEDSSLIQLQPTQLLNRQDSKPDGSKIVSGKKQTGKSLLQRWFGPEEAVGIKDAYVEVITQVTNGIRVSGWVLMKNGAADQIEFQGNSGERVQAKVVQREDIAGGFPKIETADQSGFEVMLSDELFWRDDGYQFAIVAKQNGQVVFRCQVSCRAGQELTGSAHSYSRWYFECMKQFLQKFMGRLTGHETAQDDSPPSALSADKLNQESKPANDGYKTLLKFRKQKWEDDISLNHDSTEPFENAIALCPDGTGSVPYSQSAK